MNKILILFKLCLNKIKVKFCSMALSCPCPFLSASPLMSLLSYEWKERRFEDKKLGYNPVSGILRGKLERNRIRLENSGPR